MSRLFRPLRSVTIPFRIARQGGQTIHVERVRVNKGKPRGKWTGKIIKTGLVLHFVYFVLLPPIGEAARDLEASLPDELLDDQDDLDSTFIPLPFTIKQLPPEPYSGSSPEWQEFIRVSKDVDFMEKIRRDTANMVLHAASESPWLVRHCGKNMSIRRYWMDVDFPYWAPPEYVHTGILFTDDSIELANMPIPSNTAKLLNRVLWPEPLALTIWSFGTAFVKARAIEVGRFFGLKVEDSPSPQRPRVPPLSTSQNPDVQRALQRLRQQATKRPEEVNDPRSLPVVTRPRAAPGQNKGPGDDGSASSGERYWGEDTVRNLVGGSPWQDFMKRFTQTWRPILADPPRGSIIVSGLVELETPHAWLVIDVMSWYNPKDGTHDRASLKLSVRRIQSRKQNPLKP